MINTNFLNSLSSSKSYFFTVVVCYEDNLPFHRFTVTLPGNEVAIYFCHLLDCYPSSFKIRVYSVSSSKVIFSL